MSANPNNNNDSTINNPNTNNTNNNINNTVSTNSQTATTNNSNNSNPAVSPNASNSAISNNNNNNNTSPSPSSPNNLNNDTPVSETANNSNISNSSMIGSVIPMASSGLSSGPGGSIAKLLDNSLVEVMEALETLLIYTKNLILYPDEKKYRKIKMSNIHYQERLGHLSGALEAMSAIGYLPAGEYLRLDESRLTPNNRETNALKLKEMESFILDQLNSIKQRWGTLPNRLMNDHDYQSVQGAACFSSIGKRHNMEDDEIIVDRFCGESLSGYFGLYDGHGGRATVDFVVKALHMNLEQHLKRKPDEALAEAFKQSYLATDGQLRRQNILRSGTTSVTCVIRVNQQNDKKTKTLFTANVGDSRAVLCRAGKAVRLTIDHKASLPEEAKRITDAGGFIGRNKRVNGVLAISRALGDHMLKENDVVSAEPYCTDTELLPDDSFIILACDGVWDVMTDQEAVDFVNEKLEASMAALEQHRIQNPNFVFPKMTSDAQAVAMGQTDGTGVVNGTGREEEITVPRNVNEALYIVARALVKEALDRRSLDNVTVMIVKL